HRQVEPPFAHLGGEAVQVHAAVLTLAGGVHHHVALGVDVEVTVAPTEHVIEFAGDFDGVLAHGLRGSVWTAGNRARLRQADVAGKTPAGLFWRVRRLPAAAV